jgi:hypothetical protein
MIHMSRQLLNYLDGDFGGVAKVFFPFKITEDMKYFLK